MRTFIAVPIAPQVRSRINRYLTGHITDLKRVKWVRPEDFHLTLKFLGEVPVNDIYDTIVALRKACARIEPFDLVFNGLGGFPDTARPHTLWVGVTEGVEESAELAGAIDDELFRIGFPREGRRFTPHLTIGRVKKGVVPEAGGIDSFILPEKEIPFFGMSAVDSVCIFSSELTRGGPKYEVLEEVPLKTGG